MDTPLFSGRRRRCATLLCAAALLAGCASPPAQQAADPASSPWAGQSGLHADAADAPWVHKTFPGKTATHFQYARLDGRDAMSVQAESSASMLRQQVRIAPADLGRVRFSWKVPGLIEQADLALRDRDDAPVRIVLAFEGDRSRFSARDAALSELARALTGEEMPYATLMYVWCNHREPGSVIRSPRTDRIRKLVVESGPQRLNRWLDYERDIRADYLRVFGEEPGALVGIAIMTDSDNTHSHTQAWYGPVRLVPAQRAH
ncbi:hypothetical protein GCM10028796_41210 [Ramlibacter monticola]|uniref:DUF3047 domain-containing protein n=1 Tax=Ramlibacter monticola TaxID=1926872 RepID=A0A936Z4K6_9BURK|nr:DUF3047 domain-containing protein [Ramlibacter monticola]MBL0393535.1 DUF3047 domain-containing protein [Ramlibacter monticola]